MSLHCRINASLALALMAGLNGAASALTFQGTLDYTLVIDSNSGQVQQSELVVKPHLDFDLSDALKGTLIARGRVDSADEISPQPRRQLTRSQWNRRATLGDHGDLELRELYLDARFGERDLRLGKQQVVWGQADGLRVLDVLNPIDYREFILPELEDRRIPLWMLNSEAPLGDGTLQIVLIPDQTYDELPVSDGAFAVSSRLLVPSPPANTPVRIDNPQRPHKPLQDADIGLRWQSFLGGWDVSLNYLFHYLDQAVLYLDEDANGLRVRPTYERSHLLGSTLSNAFGDFTLRGELGYSTHRYWLAEPQRQPNGIVASPELAYVIGLDYSGISDTFISVQAFQSHLTERPHSAIRDPSETQFSALLRHNLWNQALSLEAFLIQSLNDGDGLLQLEAKYQFTGELAGRVGADLFFGDDSGLFGQFAPAKRIYFGLSHAF